MSIRIRTQVFFGRRLQANATEFAAQFLPSGSLPWALRAAVVAILMAIFGSPVPAADPEFSDEWYFDPAGGLSDDLGFASADVENGD